MEKEKVPWWRWAFEVALGGIRSGFGLFRHNGKVEVNGKVEIAPETNAREFVAEPETIEVASIDEKPAESETSEVESIAEEPAENTPAQVAPAEFEAPEEEIALTNTSRQPDENATRPAHDAAPALSHEPAPPAERAPAPHPPATPAASGSYKALAQESTLALPFDPPLTAKSAPEPTTAEKVAAALKARGVDAEQSPFSVFVGQVYDGPLDLLLDLIRKQDIDIYDIPIAKITAQFLAYVDHLRASDMDVAGEFIYTAALLIHIKSKMLLPRAPVGPEESSEDPRRELVDRLLEHERFRNAAQMLHDKQMLEANTWTNPGVREFREEAGAEPEIAADTTDLVRIFRDILERARNRPIINVEEDSVTVGQMLQFLTRRLTMEDRPVALRRLLSHTHSERALIAMFLALLELVRLQAILLRQDRQFSEIFVKKNSGFDAVMNEGLANARDDWR